MGHQNTTKAMIDELVANLSKHFDGINEQLVTLSNRLRSVEQASSTDAAAATARAQQERNATLVETDARHAMEEAGHASLNEKKEAAPNISTPALVDEMINKIFVAPGTPAPTGDPTAPLPPPLPHPSVAPSSFPFLTPHIYKMTFPTMDGKEDLLPWFNRCE